MKAKHFNEAVEKRQASLTSIILNKYSEQLKDPASENAGNSFLRIPGTITPNAVRFEYQDNQYNPEPNLDTCFFVGNYGQIEKFLFDPKFRQSKEYYRQYRLWQKREHAEHYLEEVMKLGKKMQFMYYSNEKQGELFPELVTSGKKRISNVLDWVVNS